MPLLVLLAVCLLGRGAEAQYGGGKGKPQDPYLIYTAEQMNAIGANANDWDKHFKLMADIDLAGYTGTDFNIIGYYTSYEDNKQFTGVFNGNGHTISNFSYASTDTNRTGLFGWVSGFIKDLGLITPNVDAGKASYVGSLVGRLSDGTITDCYTEGGSVVGNWWVGGLVGYNEGTITNSYSTGSVSGTNNIGGLVGANSSSYGAFTISNCYATGSVSGTMDIGGRAGSGSSSRVYNSYWDIETSRHLSSAGGTGKTTAEMQMASTFLGWGGCGSEGTWTIDEGNNYPRLWWENKPGEVLETHLSDFITGAGTEDDPYLIYTADQINMIGLFQCEWDKKFKLMADIDLSVYTGTDFNIIGDISGVFDGNGHTISNFSYTSIREKYVGLFMCVSGDIKDLGLIETNINADINAEKGSGAGSLVGWLRGGTITNCYVESGNVSGKYNIGGLVGYNDRGNVAQCYSTAAVSGYLSAGGLVGDNDGAVTNCYSTGAVSGYLSVGGLVGDNNGALTNCYSIGAVSGDWSVGGLVGKNYVDVIHCFWDTETSEQATSAGGTGLTTAQMQMSITFSEWGGCGNESTGVWTIDEGNDYPRLWWENAPGHVIWPRRASDILTGMGTRDDPYLIYTAEEFIMIGLMVCDWDKHFKLMEDIDLDPKLPGRRIFAEAVIPRFEGSFDGNGHTISHLTITGRSYLGLFGRLESGAEVKNLGLMDVNITGLYNYVGGLVGYNSGSLTGCCNTGSIHGRSRVGGLVGINDGDMMNCYSNGTVSGQNSVGGLVGTNWSRVVNKCYSTGLVSGNESVGGLVGYNQVWGDVTHCFWDTQTSGQATSAGGTGLTTNQMQMASTFVEWEQDAAWTIDEGVDYPRLVWENLPGDPLTKFSYGGGSGTKNDPYLIYTAEQMNAIGLYEEDWNMHFKLMEDIDLSAYTGTDFNIIGYFVDWIDRDKNKPFTGVFDGNGHTISNFNYSSIDTDDLGLFGFVGGGTAEIKDLGLINHNINTRAHVGSLVGFLEFGTITDCYAEGGSVSGKASVGGLVGFSWGTMTRCYNTGTVSGSSYVGGLVGVNEAGDVSRCYNTGTVIGSKDVGGVVGVNQGGVTHCYSTGTVSGSSSVGGLVGFNWANVTGCYSTGAVSGNELVGGLVGFSDGTVTRSFWDIESSGQTTSAGGTGKTTAEMQMASTFVEWERYAAWTIDEGKGYPRLSWENLPGEPITRLSYGGGSGMENDPYLIYTAEQMNEIGLYEEDWDKHFKLMADIDLSSYTGRAFNIIRDFTGVFDGSSHTISNFSYTSTYTNNIGLFESVYNVNAEIKDLGLIDPNVDAGTGDRVGSLVGYLSRGNVTGCYVEGGSVSGNERVSGLVGYNYRGTITDCSANVDVSGDWYIGGLVGYNRETITDCYAAGIVSGDRYVGSLVGFNDDTIINCSATGIVSGDRYVGGQVGANEGRVTNCSATSSVSGTTAIGGLVGYNRDTISNCYSSGDVTGYSYVGGLVGYNRETITNSYSTGIVLGDRYFGGFVGDNLVGRITDSFWDIEASGQTLGVGLGNDDGISGKNMAEMQSLSTFIDASWDFVGETENGTEDIWWILEGQGYPVFVWELWDPSPKPQDGATNVIQSPILYWAPAEPTLQHDIYFGEDKEAVANATTLSLGIYCGRQPGEVATYDPGPLEWGRTYYWRIDEYNTDGTISKGNVWSFTTADFILIDDFEDYNDYPPDEIFSTWIEGWEFPREVPVGHADPPFAETEIVHGGRQSMPVYYDNNFMYSEVTKTLVYPRNWTEAGVGVLSLWFHGDASNAAEPIYVNLNGIATVYHDNPDAALIEEWTEWTIDLQEFAVQGVNLANVNTISIGFGDKNNLQAGGSGLVFFDDIRLFPELEPAP